MTIWFPLFFCAGFLVFYFLPLYKVSPHHLPVAVVGQQEASALTHQFDARAPGTFDFRVAKDASAAKTKVLDREVDGALDLTAHGATLYIAGANGTSLAPLLQKTFGPLAQAAHVPLQTVDVAPLKEGDSSGTGFLYIALIFNIVAYVLVMFVIQQPQLGRKRTLIVITAFGVLLSVVVWPIAWSSGVLPVDPAIVALSFLLTQAVSWAAYGLVPFARRATPAVLLLLFVLLSIPTSGGVLPVGLLPRFYQWFEPIMPLGNYVSAGRGVLYFHDHALVRPILVLCAWVIAGMALVAANALRTRRASRHRSAAEDRASASIEPSAPPTPSEAEGWAVVYGSVVDDAGRPVREGTITTTTADGHPLTRVAVRGDGSYATLLNVGAGAVVVITGFGADHGVGATPVRMPAGQRRVRAEVRLTAEPHRRISQDRYDTASAAAASALGGTI